MSVGITEYARLMNALLVAGDTAADDTSTSAQHTVYMATTTRQGTPPQPYSAIEANARMRDDDSRGNIGQDPPPPYTASGANNSFSQGNHHRFAAHLAPGLPYPRTASGTERNTTPKRVNNVATKFSPAARRIHEELGAKASALRENIRTKNKRVREPCSGFKAHVAWL